MEEPTMKAVSVIFSAPSVTVAVTDYCGTGAVIDARLKAKLQLALTPLTTVVAPSPSTIKFQSGCNLGIRV